MRLRNCLPAGRLVALGVAMAVLGAASPAMAHDEEDDSKDKDRDVRVYRWEGRGGEGGDADGWQWNERDGAKSQDSEDEDQARAYRFRVESADMKGGFLGVQVQSLTRSLMRARDLKSDKGALVNRVEDESPADEAGIQRGDVIVEVNRKPIDDASELTKVIREMEPGDEATVVLIRDGRRKTVDAKLGKRPRDMMVFEPRGRWRGEMPDMRELREHLKGLEGLQGMAPEDRDEMRMEMERLREDLRELRDELRELREELRDARGGRSRSR